MRSVDAVPHAAMDQYQHPPPHAAAPAVPASPSATVVMTTSGHLLGQPQQQQAGRRASGRVSRVTVNMPPKNWSKITPASRFVQSGKRSFALSLSPIMHCALAQFRFDGVCGLLFTEFFW